MVTVRFYTRRGCHLCEIAETALRTEQGETPFELAMFDIDADPDLSLQYGQLVPVTVLPNGDEMHYRIDLPRFRAGLATS